MRMLKRFWIHLRVLGRARRNRTDLVRWLVRRPWLFTAVAWFETALLLSNRTESTLKSLAGSKAAAMVNCEFCMDIAAELARRDGITEQQLLDLPKYRDSDAFTELEKLVISFAESMTQTPAIVPEELRDELLRHLSKAQLAEIAAEVSWENQRARFNQALGVRPAGFSDGAVCLIPERAAAP